MYEITTKTESKGLEVCAGERFEGEGKIRKVGRKQEVGKCVYCARLADTKDHIPSKNLFPAGMGPKNPIVVPSCVECNHRFSFDEEYFRYYVCGLAEEYSLYARQVFFSQIKRSIWRKPQIGFKLLKRMKLVDLRTETGLYLGKATQIKPTEEDWSRFSNVLDKYIKGLVFHELKDILPSEYRIKNNVFLIKERISDIMSRAKSFNFKWNTDNKDIFRYGFNFVAGTYKSAWVKVFYDSVLCRSAVFKEEDIKRF